MDNAQAILDSGTQFAPSDLSLVNGGSEPHPMDFYLEEIEQSLLNLQMGEIRTGTIVDMRSNEILIDIGYKSEGVVSGREVDRIKDSLSSFDIGADVPVYILREENDGSVQLSISRALAEADWQQAEDLMENQEIFEGEVTAHNRGGVIIKLGQVRGFVPASQLAAENHDLPEGVDDSDESRWIHLIGKNLMLKVIDLDRKRNRLILSERLAMREWRRKQKEELLANLSEGSVCEGVISSIADFGAFVNLGGADGLIHLSELSWNRIRHPKEIISVGEKVKVQVLSVDHDRKRIGLSLRRLQPQPWEIIHEMYEVGQVVQGTITKMVNFGAFARLDSGIEGLIHISELSDNRVSHPKEVVSEGEEHDLRIIRIDTDKRRMGLSLKQALPPSEEVEIDWQIAPSGDDSSEMSSELVSQALSAMGLEGNSEKSDMDEGIDAAELDATIIETEDIESSDPLLVAEPAD
ncbi:MAG: S1 RNA-binding domain-containing protein [Chloroflexota bacterium]